MILRKRGKIILKFTKSITNEILPQFRKCCFGRTEQINYFRLVIRKSDCLTQPAIKKTKKMTVENKGFRNLEVASYS